MAAESIVRLKIVGAIDGVDSRYPELLEQVGNYLVKYEPHKARKGEQWIWTTADENEALALPFEDMFQLYKTSIGTRPWDGKPDRPITIFHIELERV